MVEMAEITMIMGSFALFVAGFVAWYTLWHRKVESCFERVPVDTNRSAYLVRGDADVDAVLDRRHEAEPAHRA